MRHGLGSESEERFREELIRKVAQDPKATDFFGLLNSMHKVSCIFVFYFLGFLTIWWLLTNI